jgi:hypothetical protein
MNTEGIWTSAILFETVDLAGFEEMVITRVRLVVHDRARGATLVIWQGIDRNNLTEMIRQPFHPVEKSWINIELDDPLEIDTSLELVIGVEWNDPGEGVFPAGVDESTGHEGKGNLVLQGTWPGGWNLLSGFPVSQGDWNIQAFVTDKPETASTGNDGIAVFEKTSGNYAFTVTKEGYEPVSGNFVIRASDQIIEVTLYQHFELNLVPDPPEGGIFTGPGKYREGERATITAVPAQGYLFMSWSGDTHYLDDPDLETTTVTMPAEDITLTANFDLVISAGNIEFKEMKVFPNPFSETLTLENVSQIRRVAVVNMQGNVLIDRRLDGSETHTINTSALRSGLYFVVMYDHDGRKEIRRMIKID